MLKVKTHEEDLSLTKAFQKRNFECFKSSSYWFIPSNRVFPIFGKYGSEQRKSVRNKGPTSTCRREGQSFNHQMTYFGQHISTKSDPFVRNTTNRVLGNNARIASIRYAIIFSTSYSTAVENFHSSSTDYCTVELVAVAKLP